MSWSSEPCCGACWQAFSYGCHGEIRTPVRLTEPEREICCFCAGNAEQGIYVRVDPDKVPFPRGKVWPPSLADPAAATAPTPNGHAPGLQDEST